MEYDISRMIHALSAPKRTVVGILSTLPINGQARYNPQTGQQETIKPFAVMDQINDFFETRMLETDLTRVPENVTVLMVVHPKKLPPQTLYAIDQFALGGGKVFALVDSFAEIEVQNSGNLQAALEANSVPADLLAAWGVKIDPLLVAADRLTARRVSMARANRQYLTCHGSCCAKPISMRSRRSPPASIPWPLVAPVSSSRWTAPPAR